MDSKNPFISIIIVNWNGDALLQKCIQSVVSQHYSPIEIIVVDNASHDTSIDVIQHHFPNVTIVKNSYNTGFAKGCNQGTEIAKGEFILFLNTDAWLDSNFFPPLLHEFQNNITIGAIGPKLMRSDGTNTLDSCGSYWSIATWLYHVGYGKDASKSIYNTPKPFFSLKGAVLMVRTQVFKHIGGLDNDFWCYFEETDLCHRLWIAGYSCMYIPSSTAYHMGGATAQKIDNAYIHYHNFKNQLQSFVKNFDISNVLWIIPAHVLIMILISVVWCAQGKFKHALSTYKAIYWVCLHIPLLIQKRRSVQRIRRIPDRAYLPAITINPSFRFFIHSILPNVSYADK